MTNATHAYVGVSPCGCIRAVTVDTPEYPKEVRRDVAAFMRGGDTIEWVPLKYVGAAICFDQHPKKTGCPHPGACPYRAKATEALL